MGMSKMPMTVRGFQRLRNQVRDLPPYLAQRTFRECNSAMAKSLANTLRATTAFQDRTGRLRRSIQVGNRDMRYEFYRRKVRVKDGLGIVAVGARGSGVGYAAAIEFGRRDKEPRQGRKFMEKALAAGGKQAFHAGADAMERAFPRGRINV